MMSKYREQEVQICTPTLEFSQAEIECDRFQFLSGKDRSTFPQVSVTRSPPSLLRPSFGLEPSVQLARIMKKSQNREAGENGGGKHAARRAFYPFMENWYRRNHLETGRYIGTVMNKGMPCATNAFDLCPRRLGAFHMIDTACCVTLRNLCTSQQPASFLNKL